jgi:hypothetical protein
MALRTAVRQPDTRETAGSQHHPPDRDGHLLAMLVATRRARADADDLVTSKDVRSRLTGVSRGTGRVTTRLGCPAHQPLVGELPRRWARGNGSEIT